MDAMADKYRQQLALAEQNTTAMCRNYNNMQQRIAIKTVEIGQLQNELAVLDHNQSQLVTALRQVSVDNATLHGRIIALEKEVLVLKSAPAPVTGTSIFTPHAAPAPVTPTGLSQPHLLRIPAPPKFSSNTKDLLLESWLQSIGVWFRYYNMTNDHACIISALNLLEGGAALFMDEYSKQVSIGNTLGTWDDFVKRLETGYWNIAPEKYAQEQLDKICRKKHDSLSQFAEQFRLHASKSNYSNVELIRCINAQRSEKVKLVMVTTELINPASIPTTWATYLEYVLNIAMKLHKSNNHKTGPSSLAATHTTSKAPDAMDVDAIDKSNPAKLKPEQEKWLKDGKCLRCGKHPAKRGVKCRNPKYLGWFELPEQPKKEKVQVISGQSADSSDSQDADRQSFILAAMKAYDAQKASIASAETTARVEEVAAEKDFLQGVL
jgi:hypothetical protein